MSTNQLFGSLLLCICLIAFFYPVAACQYQPSSLAGTEVPIFIPPAHKTATSSATSTSASIEILPSETEAVSSPTFESEENKDCELATYPAYGFSADNPIQVGSNQLSDGPERELIYLLTLRGPNGEEVFYTRQAPQFNMAGTIVDPYLIEYEGIKEPVILYFDLYNYVALLVPLGFTCEAPFPIQAPQE